MGDEADAMWEWEMVEEGQEFGEASLSATTRGILRKNVRLRTFRKSKTRRKASTLSPPTLKTPEAQP